MELFCHFFPKFFGCIIKIMHTFNYFIHFFKTNFLNILYSKNFKVKLFSESWKILQNFLDMPKTIGQLQLHSFKPKLRLSRFKIFRFDRAGYFDRIFLMKRAKKFLWCWTTVNYWFLLRFSLVLIQLGDIFFCFNMSSCILCK